MEPFTHFKKAVKGCVTNRTFFLDTHKIKFLLHELNEAKKYPNFKSIAVLEIKLKK